MLPSRGQREQIGNAHFLIPGYFDLFWFCLFQGSVIVFCSFVLGGVGVLSCFVLFLRQSSTLLLQAGLA